MPGGRKNPRPAENKEALFETWQKSPEFAQIEKFNEVRERCIEAATIEMSTEDLNSDWTEVLTEFFKMREALGVKGCRAKCTFHYMNFKSIANFSLF